MIEELDDFAHHCRVERRPAPLTCRAYERDVRACCDFMQGAGIGSWQQVELVHLRRFLAVEVEHRPAPASQARTVAALKGFFGGQLGRRGFNGSHRGGNAVTTHVMRA